MTSDDTPPLRARRWTPPPSVAGRSPPRKSYRFVLRLLGIPILAVAGVFIYSGIRDRLALPESDAITPKNRWRKFSRSSITRRRNTSRSRRSPPPRTRWCVTPCCRCPTARRGGRLHVLLARRQSQYEIFRGTQNVRQLTHGAMIGQLPPLRRQDVAPRSICG